MMIIKNIQPGNKRFIFFTLFFFCYQFSLFAQDKIISSPLINLEEIKPSFEDVESSTEDATSNDTIQKKRKSSQITKKPGAKLIGLDKITAKTSEIIINLGEVKKFGPLEIKVLKCGKVNSENVNDDVAYLQVKDVSENQDEKVFIFNGWTFSSNPSITPFDHAIYDLQLVKCNKV
jgi:hypothetical protein